jgi:hypothetical protein
MYTSIWYHIEDNCPKKDGYYLAYKKSSLGDDEEGYGLYYWDNEYTDWRESAAPHSHGVRVSIWTDCPVHDPDNYKYAPIIPTPAEINAWKDVMDAIGRFNLIKELVK